MNDVQVYCERLLKDLIRIASFKEEQFQEIQAFILAKLRSLGCEAYVEENSGCIIGRKNVTDSAKTILLSAHYDTIGPTTAWTMDPLTPRQTEDRIYGLGASDCKGGIVSILAALKNATPANNAIVVITGYEDIKKRIAGKQYMGSGLIPDCVDIAADMGIVTEASVRDSKFAFVNGMFGKISFSATAVGKQSHACHPENGVNAIFLAMDVIRKLKEELPQRSFTYRGRAYQETFNAGRISGGSAVNVVPHECTIDMEYRFSPDSSLDEKKDILESIFAALKSVQLKYNFEYPAFLTEPNQHLHLLAGKRLGYPIDQRISRGGTDANIFNSRGIPAFVFGPGECDQVHQPDEYVRIKRVVECADIISGVLGEVC